MKLNRELLQTIIDTSIAASKEQYRYDLCSVLVKFNERNQATVVATDGHIISETFLEPANELDGSIKELAFNDKDVKAIKRLLKDDKHSTTFNLERTAEDKFLIGTAFDAFLLNNVEINFPDYIDAIQFVPQGPVKIVTLNADLLMRLAKSLGKHKLADSTQITLVIGADDTAPIAVFRGDGNTGHIQRAVITPMRAEAKEALALRLGIQTYEMIEESKALEQIQSARKNNKRGAK